MLDIAAQCAEEAGRILLRNLEKPRHIEQIGSLDTNLVTETDKEVEEYIVGVLRKEFPDHDILAEKSGSRGSGSEYRWIIDPLDGTTNYAHGLPLYCTSIGLERRGELVLGVIYDPTRKELYSAQKGKGAFLNGRQLKVSETAKLRESLLVTGFPYDVRSNPDHAIEHFNEFLMEARAVRRLASAAIDFCYVAAGRFDGFWETAVLVSSRHSSSVKCLPRHHPERVRLSVRRSFVHPTPARALSASAGARAPSSPRPPLRS